MASCSVAQHMLAVAQGREQPGGNGVEREAERNKMSVAYSHV